MKKIIMRLYGMQTVKRIIKKIRRFYWAPYYRKWKREQKRSGNVVFFDGYARYRRRKIRHLNWGDDLNHYFFNYACREKFVGIPYTSLKFGGGSGTTF